MSDISLQEAINKAAEQLTAAPAATAVENTPEVEIPTDPEPEEDTPAADDEPAAEPDMSDAEIAEAQNLYKALKNPTQRAAIVAALAQEAGLLTNQPQTKREEKAETVAAKRQVTDILKTSLGQYAFLADSLGPAIEEILKSQREEISSEFTALRQVNVEREVVTAYDKLATETKGASKNFEARMAVLSEEIPIGDQNVETYMRRLYLIASSERKTPPQKVADQIRRNANDPQSRLKGTTAAAVKGPDIPNKKMNLNESVQWAADQLTSGKRK